ncbi:MAG: LPS assembly protein LptD [Candidatus Omnitrophota bacterium]
MKKYSIAFSVKRIADSKNKNLFTKRYALNAMRCFGLLFWILVFACLPYRHGLCGSLYAQEVKKNELSDESNQPLDSAKKIVDSKSNLINGPAPTDVSKVKTEGSKINNTEKTGAAVQNQDASASGLKQPVNIDADTIEYSSDNKNVTASGNVAVVYQGARLTCQKITVNTETKAGQASGNVRLEDAKGIIEAAKMDYNFQTKQGMMSDARFRANPFFGKAEEIKKVNDIEFIGFHSEMSTCSFDHPHYRMKTKKVDFFRGDKIKTVDDIFSFGQTKQIPALYLPKYERSFNDPIMHVQMMPGKSKAWGPYLLSAWRYDFTEYIHGRMLLDYRDNLGVAEGFNAKYASSDFGDGNFKYYYTQERDHSKTFSEEDMTIPKIFQRYFIRARHKWDITKTTNLTTEYYKIVDSKRAIHGSNYNFLKDYFPLEYEKDTQPLSYSLMHSQFDYSSLDLLVQKRVNRWYSQLEKLPELTYTMPSCSIAEGPVYFENLSSLASYNYKNAVPSPSTDDLSLGRFDTTNKFSLPTKVAFIQWTPFVAERFTYYDKNIDGAAISPRAIFYSGSSMSTQFFRIFDVKTGLLGLDINKLRHIITPSVSYAYNHKPSVANSKLKQIDGCDSITMNNSSIFELSNKLQTKRNDQAVDLADFRIKTDYLFKSSVNRAGGSLSDFLLDLDLLPYSWLSLNSDATFSRREYYFTEVNTDLNFNFASERSFGFGYRYARKGGREVTFSPVWRINPKWAVHVYQRYQFSNAPGLSKGLREQEYFISRDLHCWTAEFTWNITKNKGESIWLVFRLKAFPELEFNYDQNYHQPKPGSQGY